MEVEKRKEKQGNTGVSDTPDLPPPPAPCLFTASPLESILGLPPFTGDLIPVSTLLSEGGSHCGGRSSLTS